MWRNVLVIVAVVLLVGADDAKKDSKSDKDKLQGTWQPVSGESNGRVDENAKDHQLIFSGDSFTITRQGQTLIKGNFKIDSSKKPKTIDMEVTESPKEDKGKTALGIYELDGDALKWCTSEPGASDRPGEFSAKEGSQRMFVTLKREKK